MTPDEIHLVLKFEWLNGRLTAPSIIGYYSLNNANEIDRWNFPETKKTSTQLQTIFDSAVFKTYAANPKVAEDRNDADKAFDSKVLTAIVMELRLEIISVRDGVALKTLPQLRASIKARIQQL